ncbi:Mannose-6-phosphate isomerase [Lachnellula suecica]|uniref:Mannose-6-phosphate isomerase n=1 Tax=Lachnellula suecica TaxID=602035 RepID=A0A8T9C161_9HELO|nr:Mannose-6-phosphate isomerase [Lachnellula suecica]
MSSSIIQLECQCNNYPWGKKGKQSLAAQFAASTPGGKFELDETKEYAEMWCGTYPTTPSLVLSSGEDLQKHLNANKDKLIGKPILDKFGEDLPFLPKIIPPQILSIAKALPLQIHPNKDLAAKLHKKEPSKFSDANHKPEIAVALSKFEVFVGFKPLPDIQHLFTSIPILKSRFINGSQTTFDSETLRGLVGKILSASDKEITEVYETLRKAPKESFGEHTYIPELLPRLAEQYDKSDPGNLVALLTMNFLVLKKGDAIYVPADGIHAYLSGDIVECMARSDNVLNTGFCPRADRDDIDTFTSALTFSPSSGSDAVLTAKPAPTRGKNGHTKILAPPMSEFSMLVTNLGADEKEVVKALEGPGVMLVTGGKGKMVVQGKEMEVREGWVFFVGVGTELEFVGDKEGLETHLAFCEA